MKQDIYIKNRKAKFEFELLEDVVAGIMLTGTEIKSIREGQASINEAFCQFIGHELWVINMNIAVYKFGTYANHEPKRPRKLLLGAQELKKWQK
ncbi:SsrA-binding protein, partial [bacterium]|nr:SsrA-binding protein [bacterium]